MSSLRRRKGLLTNTRKLLKIKHQLRKIIQNKVHTSLNDNREFHGFIEIRAFVLVKGLANSGSFAAS